MYQVIRGRRCGKTTELVLYAKVHGCAIVTFNAMSKKNIENIARSLGIEGLNIIVSVEELKGEGVDVVVDDIEVRTQQYLSGKGCRLKGYSLSLLDDNADPRNNADEVQ